MNINQMFDKIQMVLMMKMGISNNPILRLIKGKGNVTSNYRPITCLPLMWKLLTGVIADQIYAHLDQEKLLPEEQKGCGKVLEELTIYFILIGQ